MYEIKEILQILTNKCNICKTFCFYILEMIKINGIAIIHQNKTPQDHFTKLKTLMNDLDAQHL